MATRVIFDHQAFVMQTHGGISRYFTCLSEALTRLDVYAHIFAPIHRNKHLLDMANGCKTGQFFKTFPPKTATIINKYNNYKLNKSIQDFEASIVHETYFSPFGTQRSNLPTVVTVYDMIHELMPEFFSEGDRTSDWKHASVVRADHVVCISESTRADLLRIYNIPEHKTSVVHLASNISRDQSLSLENKTKHRPFILFVGQRGGYKNFKNFLAAIARSHTIKSNFDIICFGGNFFNYEEKKLISTLGFSLGQVKHFSGGDEVLVDLYLRAHAFVCPSLYEGFGLPILEAMGLGCPVICSNTSSLPEVGGDSAEYFDPNNLEEMSSTIEKVVFSDTARGELIDKGLERSRAFSWDRCAKETLHVYSNIS